MIYINFNSLMICIISTLFVICLMLFYILDLIKENNYLNNEIANINEHRQKLYNENRIFKKLENMEV